MSRKITAFAVAFIFLGVAIWWVNKSPDLISFSTSPMTSDRPVKNLSWDHPPALAIDQSQTYFAIIDTSAGTMKFRLLASEAPRTVNNFVFLAEQDFYQNTFFHRIIKNFMIQGGDPKGDGTGGPGYTFADEPVTRDYERGALAMANAGPNTNGSQFFVMHQRQDLPRDYVIFGELVEGGDVLDAIAFTPVTANVFGELSAPIERIYINHVQILTE